MFLRKSPFSVRTAGGVASAVALTASSLFASDVSVPVEQKPELVVRTEEDMVRGKENVRTVMQELTDLFSDDAPAPQVAAAAKPIEEPYAKIIPGTDGRSTLVFRPRFTSSKQLFKAIDGIITGATLVEPLDEQNVLVLSGPSDAVENYRSIMLAMDVPSSQILIEAKIVEVMFSDGMQRNLSISYAHKGRGSIGATTEVPGQSSQPTTGMGGNWKPIAGKDTLDIAFQWLLTAQDAKVLSSPNILISRNEVSRIVTGEEIPIQEANSTGNTLSLSTKFKSVGVTLEVEPSMINRDNVTLRVYPKVSNVIRYENVSAGGDTSYPVPVISARSVETYLRMQDKQVVMMGGLYSRNDSLSQQRVPILSDLPLIGELFTGKNLTKEVTQLIFFLKIHIISPEQVASGVFYDPDRSAKVSETLGKIIEYSDAIPLRETSAKELVKEFRDAQPGEAEARRAAFKNTPIMDRMSDDAAEVPEEPVDPNTPGVIRPQPLPEKTEPAKPAEAAPAAVPAGEEPAKPLRTRNRLRLKKRTRRPLRRQPQPTDRRNNEVQAQKNHHLGDGAGHSGRRRRSLLGLVCSPAEGRRRRRQKETGDGRRRQGPHLQSAPRRPGDRPDAGRLHQRQQEAQAGIAGQLPHPAVVGD